MTSLSRIARCVSVLVLLAGAALPARAQEFRGEISGRVVDESGGVLPGVTVTATNVDTNTPTSTVTNETGVFRIPYLNPGRYTLTAELEGFKKLERAGVEVRVGGPLEHRPEPVAGRAWRRPCP